MTINLHESMRPGRDRTRDPWICSQLRICNQTRYRLRYAACGVPFMGAAKALASLNICLPEPSANDNAISTKISCAG